MLKNVVRTNPGYIKSLSKTISEVLIWCEHAGRNCTTFFSNEKVKKLHLWVQNITTGWLSLMFNIWEVLGLIHSSNADTKLSLNSDTSDMINAM
jgi:hypothetical protein